MEQYKLANEKLYDAVYGEGHRTYKDEKPTPFVAMKGLNYDKRKELRFMHVGRATNGWGNKLSMKDAMAFANDAAKVMEDSNRFETEWNMQNCDSNPYSPYIDVKTGEEKKYYLSNSAFWMSGYDIWCRLAGEEKKPDWFQEIVWNNIYKVAPESDGNPSTNLIYAQANACHDIFREELRILKPTHVLLVVDQEWLYWESYKKTMVDWMSVFKGHIDCEEAIDKNQNIVQKAFLYNGSKIIVTCRPEQVTREKYVNAVVNTFSAME